MDFSGSVELLSVSQFPEAKKTSCRDTREALEQAVDDDKMNKVMSDVSQQMNKSIELGVACAWGIHEPRQSASGRDSKPRR